jgi:uncharacterized protein (DUF2345 family)
VKHTAGEYVRYDDGEIVHTNSAEGYFSIFKRGMRGNYQPARKSTRIAIWRNSTSATITASRLASTTGNVRQWPSKMQTANASRTGNLTKPDYSKAAARRRKNWKPPKHKIKRIWVR